MSRLCPPAAATSMARFACACPFTSAKSSSSGSPEEAEPSYDTDTFEIVNAPRKNSTACGNV